MIYKILGLILITPFLIWFIGYPEYVFGKGIIWRKLFKYPPIFILAIIFSWVGLGLYFLFK
jgi:hypothetical protein